jgi:hypothetical protein
MIFLSANAIDVFKGIVCILWPVRFLSNPSIEVVFQPAYFLSGFSQGGNPSIHFTVIFFNLYAHGQYLLNICSIPSPELTGTLRVHYG